MTSTVSLINPIQVGISLVKVRDKELYSVVLNFFGEGGDYLHSLTTEMVSTSRTLAGFHAYASIKHFYGAVSANIHVYEEGKKIDTIPLQELIDEPDKIRGELHYSGSLH